MNAEADYEYLTNSDFSEWMLSHQIFQKTCQINSHQMPDSNSHATNTFQLNWVHKFEHSLSPCFARFQRFPTKLPLKRFPSLTLIASAWTTRVWYPKILSMSIKSSIILPWKIDLLKSFTREIHQSVNSKSPKLVV